MEEVKESKKATATENPEFINIKSYASYGISIIDPTVEEYILNPNVPDEVLGESVREALQQSRQLSLEESDILYANISKNYKAWVEKMMKQFGYKTKRAMFKDMKSCGVEARDGIIVIRPSHHDGLESWSGTGGKGADNVIIPADSSPAEIGAALRLAFSRCTSRKF